MRIAGLLVLTFGLGLATASGARLGDGVLDQQRGVSDVVPAPAERMAAWWDVGGFGWLGGLLLVVAGGVMVRRADSDALEAAAPTGEADPATVFAALREALADLKTQAASATDEASATPIRTAIDDLHLDLVAPVVEARQRLARRQGLVPFAGWFHPFSAAERLMMRAWSGLADGYPEVATEALDAALVQLDEAARAYAAAEAPAA